MKTGPALASAGLAACALLGGLMIPAVAQHEALALHNKVTGHRNTEQVSDRILRSRAMEAVIWGMPAVNARLMSEEMLSKTNGRMNQVLYWSRPADWKNQTLTPNPDSIYFMVFYDTRDAGPLVIDVPPADTGSFAGNIVNAWQMPLEDAGPEGADSGNGGRYLILPPGYQDSPPPDYIVLPSDTYTGFALLRSNLAGYSDADISNAVAYGKRLKVYPLSQAGNPPATLFTDAYGTLFDSTIRYDAGFFQLLDRVVQTEPWLQRDRLMIDQLKTLGIEKGKPFRPDVETTRSLNAAAADAKAWLQMRYDQFFPPFWHGSYWAFAVPPGVKEATESGYAAPNEYPVDGRGLMYTYGFTGSKRLGKAQFYLMSIKDRSGQALDGGCTYRLTVLPNVPVKRYWSATVYDRATHAIIRDSAWASRSSLLPDLQKNADNSIDIYFGPRAPAGKEANWIPTSAAGQFEVMFRLYGPEQPLFDKTWKLSDIEKVN